MSDELKAADDLKDAAYRFGRCKNGEQIIAVHDTTWPIAKAEYRDDCELLADAYLARLAADERQAAEDAEPVDDATYTTSDGEAEYAVKSLAKFQIVIIYQRHRDGDTCLSIPNATKGMRRHLLAALGGTVKP